MGCRYNLKNLSLARHDYELQADSINHVYLDHLHMGLGGDDSWSPSVHEVTKPGTALAFLPKGLGSIVVAAWT